MRFNILDFIKDNTGRLVDPEKTNDRSHDSNQTHDLVVRCWEKKDIMVRDTLGGVIP